MRPLPSRVLSSALLPVLLGLSGCGAHGDFPNLLPFASSTTQMVDALEGTYLASKELLASAPLTPELAVLHRQLSEEEGALEEGWHPIRESMKHIAVYSRTLSELVHHRGIDQAAAVDKLTDAVEGMLGPVGLLTEPLRDLPVGHEFSKLADQLERAKSFRRNLKNLTRTMREVHPALHQLVHELQGDFQNLHEWSERTLRLLEEQNRQVHQQELEYVATLDGQQDLILQRLRSFADYHRNGLLMQSGALPRVAQTMIRERQGPPEGPNSRALVTRVEAVRATLARRKRTLADPAEAERMLAALEDLSQGLRIRERIEASLRAVQDTLGSGPEGKVHPLLRGLEEALGALEEMLSPRSRGAPQTLDKLGERGRDLDLCRLQLLWVLREEAQQLQNVLTAKGAEESASRCQAHGVVIYLREAHQELEALATKATERPDRKGLPEVPAIREGLRAAQRSLLPLVAESLEADLAWLQLLAGNGAAGRATPPELAPELIKSCSACSPGEATPGSVAAQLLEIYRSQRDKLAFSQEESQRMLETSLRAKELRGRLQGASQTTELDPLLDGYHLLALRIHRLWTRGEDLRRLLDLDPELATAGLPVTEDRLHEREEYWREELRRVVAQRQMVAHKLTDFQARKQQLHDSRVRIHGLLSQGQTALDHWRASHHGLSGLLRQHPRVQQPALDTTVQAMNENLAGVPVPDSPEVASGEDPQDQGDQDNLGQDDLGQDRASEDEAGENEASPGW